MSEGAAKVHCNVIPRQFFFGTCRQHGLSAVGKTSFVAPKCNRHGINTFIPASQILRNPATKTKSRTLRTGEFGIKRSNFKQTLTACFMSVYRFLCLVFRKGLSVNQILNTKHYIPNTISHRLRGRCIFQLHASPATAGSDSRDAGVRTL